jgi:hypothetical protein
MTKWIPVLAVVVTLTACDDGNNTPNDNDTSSDGDTDTDSDADADSDADSDADADFPGDCECAARFTFDGQLVDICSTIEDFCACYVYSAERMGCQWESADSEYELDFNSFPWTVIQSGYSYSSDDIEWGIVSSIGTTIHGETFVGSFDVSFDDWGGLGGTASGTFSAYVSNDSFSKSVSITDGHFYAAVIQQ